MRRLLMILGLLAATADLRAADEVVRLPRLKVSDDGRSIVTAEGKPFVYLGDTAWELFHRLDRAETEFYLDNRAKKRFNVVQAVALAEYDGLTVPNRAGDLPLHDLDPARPNNAYFKHVDWAVGQANRRGLYVGLLPTWGDKVAPKQWGIGPEVFAVENAHAYGEFLGKRYRDAGIIWILGGDRVAKTDTQVEIWRSMAAGIRAGDGGAHLIAYHPQGAQTSATRLHDEPWLDVNMLQSGHGSRNLKNYEMVGKDYDRQPPKPCLDAEPAYENHPVNWKPELGRFDEHEVRRLAYWGLFAGACGHTYGGHDIWQFYNPQRFPAVSAANLPWEKALDLPAAGQMQLACRLVESRDFLNRVPDQSLLADGPSPGQAHQQALRDRNGRWAMVYFPSPAPTRLAVKSVRGDRWRVWWYEARTGKATDLGEQQRRDEWVWVPPVDVPAGDGVLVIDDASAKFAAPGDVTAR